MDIRNYLVKNATDTAAKAPYTVRVVPNGVANLNDLVAETEVSEHVLRRLGDRGHGLEQRGLVIQCLTGV